MAKPAVRLRVIELAFVLGFAAIVARAAQVQLVHGARHRAAAEAQRTSEDSLPARRGGIYDRNGLVLAATQEVYHVGVARDQLHSPARDVALIAKTLGLRVADVRARFRGTWAYFHGPYRATRVEPLRRVKGVHLMPTLVRFYPDLDFARPLLGVPAADGRPASGIERVLDSLLTGRAGRTVRLRDRYGIEYDSPARLSAFPVPGHDVYLTLDADLQEIAQQALEEAVERLDALGGDVVVLNPATGEILAMASQSGGVATASALTDVFEPGSTAKVFAAAALLRNGLATPTDSVWAEQGTYRLGSRTIRDEHAQGWLTLQQVVERSSNIGIVKLVRALAPEDQYAMLRGFGLGSPTGVEYPTESPGTLRPPHRWSGTTAASLAIGYEMAVTPLQLAAAYGAIANDGVLLRPTLVREVRRPDGRAVYRHVPEPVRRAVTPDVARQLRAMLLGVVYGGGTGSTAALTAMEVAGKTGTARRAGPGGYVPGSHTATFASIVPADDPRLVMVVKLDDPSGAYARVTAAPVTRAMLEQVLAAQGFDLGGPPLAAVRPGRREPAVGAGTTPFVTPWPVSLEPEAAGPRAVPDVRGLDLRNAVRRLHAAGLHVDLEGWGTVTATRPASGARVPAGARVTVLAAEHPAAP